MMESSELPNGHNNQDVDDVVAKTKTTSDLKTGLDIPANNGTVSSTKLTEVQEISEENLENATPGNDSCGNAEATSNTEEGLKNDAEITDNAGKGEPVEITRGNCKSEPEDAHVESNDQEEASIKMEFPDSLARLESENTGCVKIQEETEGTKKAKVEEDTKDKSDEQNDASISVTEPTTVSFPECHAPDVHSAVTHWASNIRKQLDDIIALKTQRSAESTSLSRLRKQLTEFETAEANNSCPLIYTGGSVKKRKVRSGSPLSIGVKFPQRDNDVLFVDKPAESPPPPKVDFKSLKGLAVFAKWPNSCWHYPGIVQDLEDLNAWKETLNVTVTFYDGLQRTMKNMNILPAALIPVGAILSDLEDETELLVEGKNAIETHLVEFDLKLKPDAETIKAPFSRLAIRAIHMKKIKSLLEPNFDVAPKKMHMVSLDNLVSGRRSRIRSSKDAEEIDLTPRRGTRKSKRKSTCDEEEISAQVDEQQPSSENAEESEAVAEEPAPSPSKRRAK